VLLGRQPHHIVSTLLHAVWHRSRRSSTSDADVEESNQSRNCPSPEGSRQCCARNHRIGRVQYRAPSTNGSPGEFDRAPSLRRGAVDRGQTGWQAQAAEPNPTKAFPAFPLASRHSFRLKRRTGQLARAARPLLAGCNCSSQGGRPFCHEMTRPTTHSTTIPRRMSATIPVLLLMYFFL
jgi:hypothetical protein